MAQLRTSEDRSEGSTKNAEEGDRACQGHGARRSARSSRRPRAFRSSAYRPRTRRLPDATRHARRVSRSRAASSRRCTAAGSGRCASTPASAPPRSRTRRYRYLLDAGPDRALASPSTCRRRWATTPITAMARGEVGKVGVAIDSLDDMEMLFDGIPLDKVSTSMTINATAAMLLALYVAVAEKQGVPLDEARRHDPERHPQGVHRARHVHLPAAPSHAPHHRHVRVLHATRCRSGTRSRSAATTSARPAATAVQELAFTLADGIAYVRRARSTRASTSTTFAPRLSFFFNVPQQLPRGGREVPRRAPAVGAAS